MTVSNEVISEYYRQLQGYQGLISGYLLLGYEHGLWLLRPLRWGWSRLDSWRPPLGSAASFRRWRSANLVFR